MIAMTLDQVAAAVGGVVADVSSDPVAGGGAVVTTVGIDSRTAGPGSLFVALPGERVDGHAFAAAAVDRGAAAVLATRPLGVPAVVVEDVTVALGRLARAALAALPDIHVVGITGSSGKTTTKDLLAALLEPAGPTVAPAGSYNNEIGLPLTVLRAQESTRFLVLEYSARGPGHIAYLCGIARPDIAVVLNVGSAHVGVFGSQEVTALAKAELVEALAPGGLAVLNAEDPRVAAMGPAARLAGARVVAYGHGGPVRAEGLRLDSGRARFTLVTPQGSAPVELAMYGAHVASDALAAAAVALELGVAPADIAARLSAAGPRSRWRMEVVERADGVTVVNDAYNANPDSVRAGLETLVSLAGARRSWAVLGEMAELGDTSAAAHAGVGALAARLGVDRLVSVGPGAVGVHDAAAAAGHRRSIAVPDVAAATELLRAELVPGDVVLVKGSRSAGLDRVASDLLADVPVAAGR